MYSASLDSSAPASATAPSIEIPVESRCIRSSAELLRSAAAIAAAPSSPRLTAPPSVSALTVSCAQPARSNAHGTAPALTSERRQSSTHVLARAHHERGSPGFSGQ